MVFVVISGGIGCQLCQYAMGYSLAQEKKCQLLLDCSYFYSKDSTKPFKLNQVINISDNILIKNIWISRIIRIFFAFISCITFNKIKYKRINLKNPIDLENFPVANNYFLNGYPNNIGYFYKHINEILNKFNIKKSKYNKIRIGIHVRKGDQANSVIDFCNADFYNRALIKVVKENKLDLRDIEILVFCEELAWPKENINIKGVDLKFIIGDDETAVEDFKNMLNCTHLIIPNSFYSWWAAAYIDNISGGMIVCPDLWWDRISVKKMNIYPQSWNILATNVLPNEMPEYLSYK